MNFLKALFPKREKWIEFDTLYSIERLEQLRFFMVENHIPFCPIVDLCRADLVGRIRLPGRRFEFQRRGE